MPVDALVLLFLLALALFVFQYATLAKLAALGWVGRYESVGHFVDALNGRDIRFAASDVLLATLILALLAALAWCQWRRGSLGLLWRRLGRRRTLWLVGTGALVLGRFYLAPGLLSWTGDAPAHISYAHQAALTLAAGELPVWSNLIGAGSPYLQFYGFLFFYLVAAINLVFGDLYWSLKVALVGCHVLAALGMYSWGQAATGSRRSGLLAALAYTLCFWHTQQILIMGRLPLALFYALLPWPFYFFERLRRPQRGLENALAGGIVLGLLVWTHPGYGFWAGFFLTGYIGLRLAARWRRGQVLYGLLLLGIGTLWGGLVGCADVARAPGHRVAPGTFVGSYTGADMGSIAVLVQFSFDSRRPTGSLVWRLSGP
jgi:hypothetical protein